MKATFSFAPGLVLVASGEPASIAHLRREYGPCETTGPRRSAGPPDASPPADGSPPPDASPPAGGSPPALEVIFGRPGPGKEPPPGAAARTGGHKTVRWRVTLGDPGASPLRAWIATSGWPGDFARSLVQGYVLEPLLSVAAARAGYVLLPGAGIVADDGLLVVIGRSRAGKSTIAARALAGGRRVLGDDQLLVDATGAWRPFPRRLRFYPDLEVTAPAAWDRLARRRRAALRGRRVVASVTRGYVRPSLAVAPAELGGRWDPDAIRASRVALVERRGGAPSVVVTPADRDRAVAWAREVLVEQRSRLATLGGAGWAPVLAAVGDAEARILRGVFEALPVSSVVVPAAWDAKVGVSRTAAALGIEPQP